ncbi:hypothetical protein A8E27_10175 [Burkholderia cenocepacia]|nr:hypothetical protein A8E27_10175 [Burkholderia cenocepacia]
MRLRVDGRGARVSCGSRRQFLHFDLTAGVGTLRRTFACRPTDLLTRRPKKKKAPEGAFKMLRLVRQAD